MKLSKVSNTARFSIEEMELINTTIDSIGETEEFKNVDSFRDLVIAFVKSASKPPKTPELEENQKLISITPEISSKCAVFIETFPALDTSTPSTLLESCLDMALIVPEAPKAEEIAEIEETVSEVPIKVIEEDAPVLGEFSILLDLTLDQFRVIESINDNRVRRGHPSLTLNQVVTKAVFNRATLYNWGGEFKTYLK